MDAVALSGFDGPRGGLDVDWLGASQRGDAHSLHRSGNGADMGFCFIGAVDAKNIAIIGAGLIDGRGKELLAARPKGNSARPFLMRFVRCEGVSLKGVHLQGPAAWTTHSDGSNDDEDRDTQ